MSIIKSKHAGNFTVIPNDILKANISFEAIGLLCYLLSLPHDWVVYKKNIMIDKGIGREKLDRIFKELTDLGYIITVKKINTVGQFEYEHVVYDKPFNGEENNRCIENRSGLTDNGLADNGKPASILNKDLLKKDILNKSLESEQTNNIKELYFSNQNRDLKFIAKFLRENKPDFLEPYTELWNEFANKFGMRKIIDLTEKRKIKLKKRIKEPNFNLPEILNRASQQKFITDNNWFTFDWVLESQNNYTRVLEGAYKDKPKEKTTVHPSKIIYKENHE